MKGAKSMNYEAILLEKKDKIGIITLNRPEQLNAFNSGLAQDLNRALSELENDTEIHVVLIKGAGEAFSAGADISEFSGKTPLEYREWLRIMEKFILVIAEMGKPVVVAAHGYAVANGIGLLAAADLVIVSEGTKLGATAINVGLFCMGPALPISKCLSRKKALELVLTGDMIDATEAERIGLVNKVVPLERLDEEAMALAAKLAAKSPIALQLGKKSFYGMTDLPYNRALEYTNELMLDLCTTEDAKEGVAAFLDKRKPNYIGR
jgi:enoyl-CoA hydratase/carnithine racemase